MPGAAHPEARPRAGRQWCLLSSESSRGAEPAAALRSVRFPQEGEKTKSSPRWLLCWLLHGTGETVNQPEGCDCALTPQTLPDCWLGFVPRVSKEREKSQRRGAAGGRGLPWERGKAGGGVQAQPGRCPRPRCWWGRGAGGSPEGCPQPPMDGILSLLFDPYLFPLYHLQLHPCGTRRC